MIQFSVYLNRRGFVMPRAIVKQMHMRSRGSMYGSFFFFFFFFSCLLLFFLFFCFVKGLRVIFLLFPKGDSDKIICACMK